MLAEAARVDSTGARSNVRSLSRDETAEKEVDYPAGPPRPPNPTRDLRRAGERQLVGGAESAVRLA